MNKIAEEGFVENFIGERYRDTLLLELCSERTRRSAVRRFEDAEAILDARQILRSGRELDLKGIEEALAGAVGPAETCYLLFSDWDDGIELELQSAVAACLESCGPSVVLLGSLAALVKGAGIGDAAVKYLLRRREY